MQNKKMTEKKKIIIGSSIVAGITLIACILLATVFFNFNLFGFKSSKDKMLEFVTEKYDETFVADTFVGSSWAYDYDKLYAHSTKHPDDTFMITRASGKGIDYYSDGYFAILIRDEYAKTLESITHAVFKNSKLDLGVLSSPTPSNNLLKNTKVSEIFDIDPLYDSDSALYIPRSLYGQDKLSQTDVDKLIESLKVNRLPSSFLIYLVTDDLYDQITLTSNRVDDKTQRIIDSTGKLDRKSFFIDKNLDSHIN